MNLVPEPDQNLINAYLVSLTSVDIQRSCIVDEGECSIDKLNVLQLAVLDLH